MKVDWYLFVEHDIADATYVKWYICMNLIFQLVAITVGTVTVDVTEINAEGYNGLDGVLLCLNMMHLTLSSVFGEKNCKINTTNSLMWFNAVPIGPNSKEVS